MNIGHVQLQIIGIELVYFHNFHCVVSNVHIQLVYWHFIFESLYGFSEQYCIHFELKQILEFGLRRQTRNRKIV